MNLKHLTDAALHSETMRWNKQVNRALTVLLYHLMENDRRRLYSAHKHRSLHEYAQRELKLSEDEATRRIDAMKMLREFPEIQPKITAGNLSMTNLLLARVLFSKEEKAGRPFSKKQKRDLLAQFENKSTRVAKKIAVAINPDMKSKKSNLNFENIEDETLRNKLLEIAGMHAHTHPNLGLEQLLHKMCDDQIALHRHRKLRDAHKRNSKLADENASDSPRNRTNGKTNKDSPKSDASAAPRKKSGKQQSAPQTTKAEIKRQLWARDQHKCTNCGSTHAIQEDHRIPKSVGGKYTLENLRLRCRSCNLRAAVEFFGADKMENEMRM